MRVVLVNWARIWDGASVGGGVNGYCQSLALALRERGHDVVSVMGGTTHVTEPAGCFVRRHDDWLGVRVFEFINSSVLAPSIQQFSEPMGEVSAPELEREFDRLLEMLRPDVVHFNNIEGFSIGCVDRARERGCRVVFSLHNYHTICPQVYLMQRHREVCFDYDNGHNCETCIDVPTREQQRQERIESYLKEVGWKPPAAPTTAAHRRREAYLRWRDAIGWVPQAITGAMLHARELLGPRPDSQPEPCPVPLPGHSVSSAQDVIAPALVPATLSVVGTVVGSRATAGSLSSDASADTRGTTRQVLGEVGGRPTPDRIGPEYRPLLNLVTVEPPSDKPLNEYGKRRLAMVEMLNRCDRALAVSDFVRRKFEAMGVDARVVRTQPIGSRITRVVELSRELVFDPPVFDRERPRPVRIVFMGYNHYYKGLQVLADALGLLTPDELSRIELSIHALDGQAIEHVFRRMEPRLAKLVFVPGYTFHDIPWMLGGKDLGIVCSVWWDNGPQTVFEFMGCGVPVLGAAVGGIPDFIRDGHDGLLFRGNDRDHLAARLREIVYEPWLLERLRSNVRPPKGMTDHAAEIEAVYQGVDPGNAEPATPPEDALRVGLGSGGM
ncbi:MAG: glycosyltransferase [Phycisphaerales bacterium]|nr:glycosyltransferase [Phycisphaerales bacterium]